MESVSKQEYMRVLSELDMLSTKFVALEQENQRLLGDLQQVTAEKAQQYEELSQRVHQLEATLLQQQATGVQNSSKDPKISLPAKFLSTGIFATTCRIFAATFATTLPQSLSTFCHELFRTYYC
jgi:hypothetical protein